MAASLAPYLNCVRESLTASFCLRNFPSQVVERHNKPEVEIGVSRELILRPIRICRNENEKCLIEPSVNSVRISLAIKQADHIEEILTAMFSRFLTQRAEQFFVMRRHAVAGYDISFLVTSAHLEIMWRHKVVDFIINFMEEVDKEISAMKIALNTRANIVGTEFIKAFKP